MCYWLLWGPGQSFMRWASQKMVFLLSAGLFPPPLFILSVAALLLLIDGIKIRVFSGATFLVPYTLTRANWENPKISFLLTMCE